MTEPMTRHGEVVHHLRRHTELRKRAAEEAVNNAVGEDGTDQEGEDGTSGG